MTKPGSRSIASRVLAMTMTGGLVVAFWGCGGTNSAGLSPPGGDAGGDATSPTDDGGGSDSSPTPDATQGQDATSGADGGVDSSAPGTDASVDANLDGGADSTVPEAGGEAGPTEAGMEACVPQTCAQLKFNCGMQGDTCGNTLDCGTCPGIQTCGGGGTPGVCGTTCVPKTCAQQGFNCGMATDGCGGIIDCGSCPMRQTCGTGGANVCGGPSCTGLCQQQQTCPGTATTSISGTVFAPNGTDPLDDVLVYVPNGPVQPFAPGVSCGACGADVSGSPLVSAVTGVDGTFTITNMPVGTNIPLVIQTGRWRRQFVIPNVAACVNTPLPSTGTSQLRMPRTSTVHAGGEGDIPLMGFVTGAVDTLECALRKIGIADSEFSDPSGTGRVRLYLGAGGAGAQYSATTPSETTLWGSQATINQYDMVYFACQGADYEKTTAQQSVVISYANAGGRVFATHYSYVWLYDDAPFSSTASWAVDPTGANAFTSDPGTGLINTSFPKGLALAQWLKLLNPASTLGQVSISALRHDFTGVVAPSQLWVTDNDPGLGTVPMHYTFDTPVGALPANQCGKVLFNDYHVEDASSSPPTGLTFPAECTTTAMSPQEKMLEFDLFDLGSCVAPAACTPSTCAKQSAQCGPVGDGCGNILQCGACPSGEACISGTCTTSCTPKSCSAQGFSCGMQSDGCGNAINCGACPSGTCGAGGMVGVCGIGTCTPATCASLHDNCGQEGDGCGNVINCGACPSGQTCGGGGVPGICGSPVCTPRSCAQQGFNCGTTTDGCGNVINCGACPSPQVCGGGFGGQPGQPNVCGGTG